MKTIIISIFMAMMAIAAQAQQKSFYDFTVKTIDGEDISLSTFKGKKVLVVNVASKCGFTPQYAKLEELYEKYGKDNFVIIGFPANNFLSQEPGSCLLYTSPSPRGNQRILYIELWSNLSYDG